MPHLVRFPAQKTLLLATGLAALLTAGFYTYFLLAEGPMAPYNSVAYQYAWTPDRARQMFTIWGAAGQAVARRSLLVDFAFMPCYVVCFGGLALLAARAARGRWQTLGLWLAGAPLMAWGFDAAENLLLLNALASPAAPPALSLTLAGVASILKFSFLGASLLYTIGAGIYHVVRHRP